MFCWIGGLTKLPRSPIYGTGCIRAMCGSRAAVSVVADYATERQMQRGE